MILVSGSWAKSEAPIKEEWQNVPLFRRPTSRAHLDALQYAVPGGASWSENGPFMVTHLARSINCGFFMLRRDRMATMCRQALAVP
jgi:hypothetical protein